MCVCVCVCVYDFKYVYFCVCMYIYYVFNKIYVDVYIIFISYLFYVFSIQLLLDSSIYICAFMYFLVHHYLYYYITTKHMAHGIMALYRELPGHTQYCGLNGSLLVQYIQYKCFNSYVLRTTHIQ